MSWSLTIPPRYCCIALGMQTEPWGVGLFPICEGKQHACPVWKRIALAWDAMLLASDCDDHDEPWHQSQRLSKYGIQIEIHGTMAILSFEARPFQPLQLYHHFSVSCHFYLLPSYIITISFSIFVILRISKFSIQNALTSTPDETWHCLLHRLPTRRLAHRHSIFSFFLACNQLVPRVITASLSSFFCNYRNFMSAMAFVMDVGIATN